MTTPPEAPAPQFPLKIALAVGTAVAILTVWHLFDRGKGLSPAIFADAARIRLVRHNPALAALPHSQNGIQQPKGPPAKLPPISPYMVDDSGALDPFFAALRGLELPAQTAKPEIVTVLHYGDSPTTADLITGDVRALLQQRFGDAGHGFLLTAKPWAWYQHRDVDISDKGWTISTAVGKGREEIYGIGGASFEGGAGASSEITLHDGDASTAMEISYLARPNGGSVAVSANGAAIETFATSADTAQPAWRRLTLPAGTKTIDLKPAVTPGSPGSAGSVRLFGETFFTGRRGVLYDSLGLNGASTTVLSNGFNAAAWAAEMQHEQPKLIIINYGTNESGFGSFVDKQYEPVLRATVARIRAALPTAPILIMSPMDRGRRSGVDQIETFDTIPRIVAIQRNVAADLHCGFFDTFDAMGGDGTMARWYQGRPRLVAGDLIHPTPQGASMVAQLFVHDLALGYERYLSRQPGYHRPAPAALPAPVPAKQASVQTPAKTQPAATTSAPARPKPSAYGAPVRRPAAMPSAAPSSAPSGAPAPAPAPAPPPASAPKPASP